MTYNILFSNYASRQFKKLPRAIQIRSIDYLETLANLADPTLGGDGLAGKWKGYWKYRVGDYRIITKVEKDRLLVMVLEVGHRSFIYKN